VNLAHAPESLATRHDLEADGDGNELNRTYYYSHLEANVTRLLLTIAVAVRTCQDLIKDHERDYYESDGQKAPYDWSIIEAHLQDAGLIGSRTEGGVSKTLALREACNKIVHAKKINFILESSSDPRDVDLDDDGNPFREVEWERWTGDIDLFGTHNGKEWTGTIYLDTFCEALIGLADTLDRALADYEI
jgi:hypothetical protein